MAEQVQAVLDRMVPALRDLMEKEVFTQVSLLRILFLMFLMWGLCKAVSNILNFSKNRLRSKLLYRGAVNTNTFSVEDLLERATILGISRLKRI